MAEVPIRNEIRRLRFDQSEMTQADLADRIGVTRQTVNAIELAKYSPSLRSPFASPTSSAWRSKAFFTTSPALSGKGIDGGEATARRGRTSDGE